MQDDLYAYFLSRVIANLHIVLCMSPIGEGQGLTLVHVRAQLEQLQDTFMS
jgi:hypothetical protein